MKLNFIKSQSSVKPDLVDTTSSKTTAYVRRDIEEVETENGIKYTYEEAKLTKDEYDSYIKEIMLENYMKEKGIIY